MSVLSARGSIVKVLHDDCFLASIPAGEQNDDLLGLRTKKQCEPWTPDPRGAEQEATRLCAYLQELNHVARLSEVLWPQSQH